MFSLDLWEIARGERKPEKWSEWAQASGRERDMDNSFVKFLLNNQVNLLCWIPLTAWVKDLHPIPASQEMI